MKILSKNVKIAADAFEHCPKDMIIYGYVGSTAEQFAKANNIKFIDILNIPVAVSKIVLTKQQYNIKVGNIIQLKASIVPSNATDKTLLYKTSNPKIAYVNKKGYVKGMSAGSATIGIASADGKAKTYVKIVVTAVATTKAPTRKPTHKAPGARPTSKVPGTRPSQKATIAPTTITPPSGAGTGASPSGEPGVVTTPSKAPGTATTPSGMPSTTTAPPSESTSESILPSDGSSSTIPADGNSSTTGESSTLTTGSASDNSSTKANTSSEHTTIEIIGYIIYIIVGAFIAFSVIYVRFFWRKR